MIKPQKKIGILGGAGPSATANFFSDIILICQNKYKAEQDTDFPVVYLYNMPMEGFNETGFDNPELVKKQLMDGVKFLESCGADFIVLPCNTVHYFIDEMRSVIKIPIISIVESTIEKINENNIKNIGILSSKSTRELELYKNPIVSEGLFAIVATDEEQDILDKVVLLVMSGNQGQNEKNNMNKIIDRMCSLGAEAVILGCTELPLAISQKDSKVNLLNTIHILAEKAVDEAYLK